MNRKMKYQEKYIYIFFGKYNTLNLKIKNQN